MQRLVVVDLPFLLWLFALSSCMGYFRRRIREKSKAIIAFSVFNIDVMLFVRFDIVLRPKGW